MSLDAVLQNLWAADASTPFPEHEITALASPLAEKVLGHFDRLRAIVERHEALICRRWTKKSKIKRRQLLLVVWPGMPTMHRPDIELWSPFQPISHINDEDAWSYINLEDLTERKLLLMFINARGRSHPMTFARSELNYSPFAKLSSASLSRCPSLVMDLCPPPPHMSSDETDEAKLVRPSSWEYGQVYKLEVHAKGQEKQIFGMFMHAGHGLQTLHMQERIYRFLVECCGHILHDIPTESLIGEHYPIQPELHDPLDHEDDCTTFAAAEARSPYCTRNGLSVGRLRHLISALFDYTKHELWALREDPGYFAEVFHSIRNSQPELVLDKRGEIHERVGTDDFTESVLRSLFLNAHHSLIRWNDLLQQFTKIEEMSKKYPQGIDEFYLTPNEYVEALQLAYFMLDQTCQQSVQSNPGPRIEWIDKKSLLDWLEWIV
ncbi:hypothetical protein BDV95DRAFT_600614 [Massariosphaeria phaeospora]|uniref:Uncharacterized protein n=1 Tax=Massariosphaeria phaeospora TaxID=100035 RepID=A0A7C8MDN0_9PLEO|nr:hypothetical protein BDV95DRAFT_600614 [Massariosphaeria phaeospora]